jgi:hypothetical protein
MILLNAAMQIALIDSSEVYNVQMFLPKKRIMKLIIKENKKLVV